MAVNEDKLRTKNVISAENVRKLPLGTVVIVHSYDRRGEHTMLETTVIQSGKSKKLAYSTYWGPKTLPIAKDSDRKWYSIG